MSEKSMIVKVQLSMPKRDMVLIYDRSRKHVYEGKASREVVKLLSDASAFRGEGGWKAFFHARLTKDPRHPDGIRFELGQEADWQGW